MSHNFKKLLNIEIFQRFIKHFGFQICDVIFWSSPNTKPDKIPPLTTIFISGKNQTNFSYHLHHFPKLILLKLIVNLKRIAEK